MSGALLKTPLRQVQSVQQLLMNEQARNQLAMVATRFLTPERMMRVIANAIRRTPALQECEPMSFLGAMMFCAQMGLEPQSPLGLAHLVPFNKNIRTGKKDAKGKDIWEKIKTVEVVIGYKGFKELARRSGEIKSMHGDIVYEGDAFSHEYGTNQHLKHIPCGCNDKDKALGAYFHVAFQGGEGHVYMTRAEIEDHRNRYSKGWQDAVKNNKTADSPWQKDWEAMWIKTPCRRLMSRGDIPMSVEMMDALAADEEPVDFTGFAFDPKNGPVVDAELAETGEVVESQGDGQPAQIEQAQTQRADFGRDASHTNAPARKTTQPRADSGPYAGAPSSATTGPANNQPALTQEQAPGEQASMFHDDPQPQKSEPTPPDYSQNQWAKVFLGDVRDMGQDDAFDLHSDMIARMKDEQPGLWTWVCEQMAQDSQP